MMDNEVMDVQPNEKRGEPGLPTVRRTTATPADLVMYAMDKGVDIDRLEKLMELQERWEKNEARKAYTAAMAEFKLNPPEILKDKHVMYRTDKGVTQYDHATIGNVVENIVGGLAKHGFSHRWIPGREDGGMVTITCVVTHRLGHSEETKLSASLDTSGGKNNIQAQASTITYLQRYSLLAATGLATKDQLDDDGAGAGGGVGSPPESRQEKEKKKEPAPLPACTDAKFTANKEAWQDIVKTGRKTPEKLIEFLGARMVLNDEQKKEIGGWKKAASTEEFDRQLDESVFNQGD